MHPDLAAAPKRRCALRLALPVLAVAIATASSRPAAAQPPPPADRGAQPAGIAGGAAQTGDDSTVPAAARSSTRRRFLPSQTQITLGGKKVRILFGELRVDSPDYESLQKTAEGAVFEYTGSRCIKLFTDLDLQFGATRVAAANLAPDYPGVYSLWLRKTVDGWRLVFNEEGDIWGSMHDPARDVAEVTLETVAIDQPQELLDVTLTADGDRAGVLHIAWGDTAWSARFATP